MLEPPVAPPRTAPSAAVDRVDHGGRRSDGVARRTVPLTLLLSTNFERERDATSGELHTILIDADTLHLSLPIDQQYPLNTDRVLARLRNPSTTVTATVHMRIYLGDREAYSQAATLRDAELEYVFIYF